MQGFDVIVRDADITIVADCYRADIGIRGGRIVHVSDFLGRLPDVSASQTGGSTVAVCGLLAALQCPLSGDESEE